MQAENQRLKQEVERLKSHVKSLESKISSQISHNHPQTFWSDLENKLQTDTDYVKGLVKDGTINMKDMDNTGKTLLHYAAWYGNYEIAQLCLNLGADINQTARFNWKQITPAQFAKESNADNIAQLLLFAQTKANVGDKIIDISQSLLKQDSIIDNIMNELSLIGEQSKDLCIKTMTEITINLISKKLVFSDDLLNLCWKNEVEKGNELESELWTTIKKTAENVISGSSKRDWYWLKQWLLPSNV